MTTQETFKTGDKSVTVENAGNIPGNTPFCYKAFGLNLFAQWLTRYFTGIEIRHVLCKRI